MELGVRLGATLVSQIWSRPGREGGGEWHGAGDGEDAGRGGGGGTKEFARAGRGLQAERLLYTKSYCLYVVWKCSQPVVIVVTLATTNYVALR